MRSSSSKLKPVVQAAKPSTNDPRSEVRFIERRLLNDGTIELAHVPVRPDYVSAGSRARGRGCQRYVGPNFRGSPITAKVFGRRKNVSRCIFVRMRIIQLTVVSKFSQHGQVKGATGIQSVKNFRRSLQMPYRDKYSIIRSI